MKLFITLCCIAFALLVSFGEASEEKSVSRGWNDKIPWTTFADGLKRAKEENKPALVLIHKTWCGACQRLKSSWKDDKEVEQLSSNFVMVKQIDIRSSSWQIFWPIRNSSSHSLRCSYCTIILSLYVFE